MIISALISCQNERKQNYIKTRDDLVLKIEPFETKSKTFDYLQNNDSLEYLVFAGKIKINHIIDFIFNTICRLWTSILKNATQQHLNCIKTQLSQNS
ncbi:hypothetical protein TXIAM_30338 [Tenacibaculum xiamenense]